MATKSNEDNIEYIRVNTQRMAEALEKIAENTKFINWNLGKLVAIQVGDKKTLKKITDEEAKTKVEN